MARLATAEVANFLGLAEVKDRLRYSTPLFSYLVTEISTVLSLGAVKLYMGGQRRSAEIGKSI